MEGCDPMGNHYKLKAFCGEIEDDNPVKADINKYHDAKSRLSLK